MTFALTYGEISPPPSPSNDWDKGLRAGICASGLRFVLQGQNWASRIENRPFGAAAQKGEIVPKVLDGQWYLCPAQVGCD